ncbi:MULTISPECIES: hypothetical protein [Candidatus Nitrosocaldus]|nr:MULTISPECIES: hypothetical protein [Candidatus Nitrosocaldus]
MINRKMSNNKVTHGNDTYADDDLRRRMLWDALQGALSMLGESSMKAIIHHLSKRGVSINNISIKELEVVLYSLFGDGANVIMREMYKRLEKEEHPELVLDDASAAA